MVIKEEKKVTHLFTLYLMRTSGLDKGKWTLMENFGINVILFLLKF